MPDDNYFMSLAFTVAAASRCIRAKYGSVLVSKDNRIISTGYNGKPAGSINDHICYRENLPDNSRALPNCCLHSEVNCLLYSDPVARRGGTLYVSGRPCQDCTLVIAQSSIDRCVYYVGPNVYTGHMGDINQDFLDEYGIKVKFIPWNGLIEYSSQK